MNCIVKGCNNKKEEGGFVGDICIPCHQMFVTGKIGFGNTFLHELCDELDGIVRKLSRA